MSELKIFRVADTGRGFASREKARTVFESLQAMLANQPPARPAAIVDWSGVNVAGPGFVDEFIGLLCPEGANDSQWAGIVFTNINPYIQGQVHTILRRRGCKIKYAPSPEVAHSGPWINLGESIFNNAQVSA